MPAKNLKEIYQYFTNKPLNINNFNEFWVNTDEIRGEPRPVNKLKNILLDNPDGNMKFLFAGHRGCGKTTELVRLHRDLNDQFLIFNFSVLQELDINNMSYIELFITVMEKLFTFAEKETRINLPDKLLQNIINWTKTKEIETIRDKYLDIGIETGAELEASLPFLLKFFSKFRASAKASSSLKETLKQVLEPKLSELIFNCNLLLNEIALQIKKINKKGIIIIIEDLDKLDLSRSEDIFFVHSPQLTQLNCHCIFTYPIALLYNIKSNSIKNNYTERLCLPMIKVRQRNGEDFAAGIKVIEQIIKERMDFSLFEKSEILVTMIKKTGGCLWDLFRLIKDASLSARDHEREKITEADYVSAYNALKTDYEQTIAENKGKGIKVEAYYETLAACAKDEKKKPPETDILLDLRHNLSILNYNGENWSDVHPVVKDILLERGLLET